MSYWVYLEDANGPVTVPRHNEGATLCLSFDGTDDGITDAEINVTYNYSRHFCVRDLHGKTAKETIPLLRDAVERLGTQRDPDYWAPTPGNAGYTCNILLGWAQAHPDAVWEVH